MKHSLAVSCNKYVSYIVSIFCSILVLFGVYAIINSDKNIKEDFANLPLEPINTYQPLCSRSLSFSKFTDSLLTASVRAHPSDLKSSGTCGNIDIKSPQVETDMTVIEENNILYSLKYVCLRLAYDKLEYVIDVKNPNAENNKNIKITFANNPNKMDDMMNILYILLTDPIYIEFEDSVAYVPDYTSLSYFTNTKNLTALLSDKTPSTFSMSFKRLLKTDSSSHPTFKYSPSLKFTNQPYTKEKGFINAKIYFLDDKYPSMSGRKLPLMYKENNTTATIEKIYKNDYELSTNKNDPSFFFYQKIEVMYQNGIAPVFNMKLEISIPQSVHTTVFKNTSNKSIEILKIYMQGSKGRYSSCTKFAQLENNNNNILSAYITGYNTNTETYKLSFVTGSHDDNGVCAFDPATTLEIELPFVSLNERILTYLTVSPSFKMALCKWKINENQNFVFKRTSKCSQDNNFAKLFSKKNNAAKKDDINLVYNTNYVKSTHFVQLGRMNLMDEFISN